MNQQSIRPRPRERLLGARPGILQRGLQCPGELLFGFGEFDEAASDESVLLVLSADRSSCNWSACKALTLSSRSCGMLPRYFMGYAGRSWALGLEQAFVRTGWPVLLV